MFFLWLFSDQNTWEPEENLDCPELIQVYLDSVKLPQQANKRKLNGGEGVPKMAKMTAVRSNPFFNQRVWILFVGHKTQCPQIYIKLTIFEDNDSRKLPLKYYLLRCCSFWLMSKTSHKNNFCLRRRKFKFFTHFCHRGQQLF